MRNDRFAKAPLLYIQQANTEKIRANMQHQYMSKKENKHEKTQDKKAEHKSESRGKKVRAESFYKSGFRLKEEETEVPVRMEQQDEREEKSRIQEKQEGKSFKDMNVTEKLVYLTDKPSYAPRVTCEIKTEERTYRGIVLQYQDEIVKVRSGKRNIDIPLANIKQIRMLGL